MIILDMIRQKINIWKLKREKIEMNIKVMDIPVTLDMTNFRDHFILETSRKTLENNLKSIELLEKHVRGDTLDKDILIGQLEDIRRKHEWDLDEINEFMCDLGGSIIKISAADCIHMDDDDEEGCSGKHGRGSDEYEV